MPKKKKHSKQGMFSKLVNIGFIALAFARPLGFLFRGNFAYFSETDPASVGLIGDATGNMGKDLPRAFTFYAPIGVSIGLKKAFNFVRRQNPVS